MRCQRQFAQHQPFSSTNFQHGMQRQNAAVPTRTTPKSSRRQTKRCQTAAALDVREVINNLKQQAQKQKTAAVLGILGAVAAGLAVAGEHSSYHTNTVCILQQAMTAIWLALLTAGPGLAADMVKTGTCLLGNCQVRSHKLTHLAMQYEITTACYGTAACTRQPCASTMHAAHAFYSAPACMCLHEYQIRENAHILILQASFCKPWHAHAAPCFAGICVMHSYILGHM